MNSNVCCCFAFGTRSVASNRLSTNVNSVVALSAINFDGYLVSPRNILEINCNDICDILTRVDTAVTFICIIFYSTAGEQNSLVERRCPVAVRNGKCDIDFTVLWSVDEGLGDWTRKTPTGCVDERNVEDPPLGCTLSILTLSSATSYTSTFTSSDWLTMSRTRPDNRYG